LVELLLILVASSIGILINLNLLILFLLVNYMTSQFENKHDSLICFSWLINHLFLNRCRLITQGGVKHLLLFRIDSLVEDDD